MNYYEHHLGDYLRDTAHLSMIEDGAYRRLLDAYYIREAPLPTVMRDVFRLVRAQSKQDREAVETVLREFFTETPEGWTHSRCDREIAGYHETIPDREARKENDRERQRRARERRKQLFETLRAHNIVPAFDTKTSELEALLSRVTNAPGSRNVTAPVTRDNTATQTPDTRHQTPEEEKKPPASRVPPAGAGHDPDRPLTAKDLEAEGVDPVHAADWLKVRKAKKAPLTVTAWEAVKREAATAGITPAKAVQVSAENGWQGFRAAWYGREQKTATPDLYAGAV